MELQLLLLLLVRLIDAAMELPPFDHTCTVVLGTCIIIALVVIETVHPLLAVQW